MPKRFWAYLPVGLVAVGLAVAAIWTGTKSAHLDLTGKILKVRIIATGENSTLVVVDFRITNPSGVPLVVREVSMKIQPYKADALDGSEVSKQDVGPTFQALPLLGQKYNDVLAPPDIIPPGKTLDRMAAASFDLPQSAIEVRKAVILHIEDLDGAGFDITDAK